MSDNGGEDPRAIALERLTVTLAHLEALFKSTKNPLYVWEAISAQSFLWKDHRRFGGERFNLVTPPWVGDYLVSTAGSLTSLNLGYVVTDHKKRGVQFSSIDPKKPRFSIDPIDPKKLSDKVAGVLGLAVDGGNAFKKYRSTRQDLAISERVGELRASGLTRQQAILQYMAESKEVDFSVLEKRLTRGDKLTRLVDGARRKPIAGQ